MGIKKTAKTRADEFEQKTYLVKTIGNISLTDEERSRIEDFFDSWLKYEKVEIHSAVYVQIYRLVKANKTGDLYELRKKLLKLKQFSLPHFKLLYGVEEGIQKYNNRGKNLKECMSYNKDDYLLSFIKKKVVVEYLDGRQLTPMQLKNLEILLINYDYTEFYYKETVAIDLVLNFDKNHIERYEEFKKTTFPTLDYFKARYGEKNGVRRHKDHIDNISILSRNNFSNCEEYWITRGYTKTEATELVSEEQRKRSIIAKENFNGLTCRNEEFWIKKGYSELDAKNFVKTIQTRDLSFFVNKYGDDEGNIKYHNMIQKRIDEWNKKPDYIKEEINKSKGRTYEQMIEEYGEEKTNKIICAKLSNNGVSKESMLFFEELDSLLPNDLSKLSKTAYKTPEYWVKSGKYFYFIDYKIENCVIEYNGSFWHADKRLFSEDTIHPVYNAMAKEIWQKDKNRVANIRKLGYYVLEIWSMDVKNNRQEMLEKCRSFIYEHISNTN